jgi:plastocyanin
MPIRKDVVMNRHRVIASFALLVPLAACVGADPSGNVGPGSAAPDAEVVVMRDDEFDPGTLELEAGETVTVEVRNDGGSWHDFTLEEVGLSTGVVRPGEVMTPTFRVPDGATEYRCTIHADMTGEIVGVRR